MLTPLPRTKPVLFRVQRARVNKACLFSFGSNQYSVPKEYARQYVRLEIYEHTFRVMANNTEIGKWPRTTERGKQFLIPEHYHGRFKGTKQSALEVRFKALCEPAPAYLEGLVESRGHSLREQMQQIVQLSEEYCTDELDRAMTRALQYRSFGYDVLHRILKKQRDIPNSLPQVRGQALPLQAPSIPHVGVETRDPSYYAVRTGGAPWKTSSTG